MYLRTIMEQFLHSLQRSGDRCEHAANACATAVGSKALTMKQAVFPAIIFETSGAILGAVMYRKLYVRNSRL